MKRNRYLRIQMKRAIMYLINAVLIAAVVLVWSVTLNTYTFALGLLILFLCGVYIYIDVKILLKGEDGAEDERTPQEQQPQRRIDRNVDETERISGRVMWVDGVLFYYYQGEEIVQIDPAKVKLIGEYTTSDGPYWDDWFIVFYYNADEVFQIPMYAVGMNEFLDEKAKEYWGPDGTPRLYWSTTYRSRIVYPVFDEDVALWDNKLLEPANTKEKILYLFGNRQYERILSPTAISALKYAGNV